MATRGRVDYSTADFWDRLVQRGPATAITQATELIDSGVLTPDGRALARSAVARSLFETGRIADALDTARHALEESADAETVKIPVAMTASVILAEAGYVGEAIDGLRDLAETVDGVELGRIRLQVAYVLHHAGRLNDALPELEAAEALFVEDGEERDRFRVFHHRGLVLLQQGRLREADADFEVAESIAAQIQLSVAQGQTASNRAVLSGRARRLAESLRHFDRAAALFESAGNPARTVALTEIDRAEVLMHSGLPLDAIAAANAALARVEPLGNRMLLGDALLILARAQLSAGRSRHALETAARAESVFADSGREDMVKHAAVVRARATLRAARSAESASEAIASAVRIGTRLAVDGWLSSADELALERVRTGWRCGVLDDVHREIDRLRSGADDGQRHTALAGWFCEALDRSLTGDLESATAACLTGLDQLDDIVAETTSLEQRSAAMQLGHDLSQFTIDLAVRRGDADTVLAAAEGTRARALHHELNEGGGRHEPLTELGAERLRRELTARLGERVLVEWVVSEDVVWAVLFDAEGGRLVRIAERGDVVSARDRLNVWLDLAAIEPDGSSSRAERAAAQLSAILIEPLGLPEEAGVVIVPVGALHDVPWSGLPGLSGRAVTLAPNGQLWLEADRRAAGGRIESVGLVVGPDVGGVDGERRAVEAHGHVAVAAGPSAGVTSVRSMFTSSDLLHVAAHGTFRSDRPLLSTIRLHEVESTLYDLIPDRIGSRLVILSSCEGGAQGTADGSEVLGFSAVLLARGAAAVMAPLTVVRDLECAEFVADVHEELRAGRAISDALAAVRTRWLGDDDLSRWAVASSFSCFGSGSVSVTT